MAGPARAFKEARWLSGVKPLIHNQAQIKGTVEEVGGHKNKDSAAVLVMEQVLFSDNSRIIFCSFLFFERMDGCPLSM